MKSYIAIVLLVIAILGIIALVVLSDNASSPVKNNKTISKKIQNLQGVIEKSEKSSLTMLTTSNNEVEIFLEDQTEITDTYGNSLKQQDLYKGFTIQVSGTTSSDTAILAEKISVKSMPNILLYEPTDQATVTNSFRISGIARVFENVVSLRIKNLRTNKIILTGTLEAKSPDVGLYGPFSKDITLNATNFKRGDKVEITTYQSSAKDGSEIDTVIHTVSYDTVEHLSIKLYFPNDTRNASDSCDTVYSVSRDITKTPAVAKAALSELLKGPTESEVIEGYATALNEDLSIRSVIIRDQTAYVDFSSTINKNLSGTCRITALKQQVTRTLLQFPTIKQVVFLSEGKLIPELNN